ncbi:hypothetical protein C1646_769124 [Rhizophagus diaphanus]|nr:hypothetical protein C1646_769124 [Rhizophagus diaphanus] [Rhizophagus sp. MUCL 43196]
MTCSKLFSGDLPELWCRLAIPLLWEDPFSIKFPKNYYFIEIYLNNLNDDDKNSTIEEQHSNYSIKNVNLSLSQFTKLIFGSLILLFIKNEVNLHSFKVTTCIGYRNEIIELILQNRDFIYNIKNFVLNLDRANDNTIKFLEFLCSNYYNSISSLYFQLPSYNIYPIIEKYLSKIIKSQENLKKISFGFGYDYSLYHSLLSLNNHNCSNTLNTIVFYYISFKNINILSEVFNQLNVLESIHIVYCYYLNSKFIQQINNIIKPFKLKSLFLNEINYESLEPLIQKSGNYLENFGFYHPGSQKLLQLIIKYCNKIKFLFPIWPNDQFIYLVYNIIENIKQNLNYLSIDLRYNSIILQNLGQILPFELEYLNLRLNMINANDLELFLKNSLKIFLLKNY